MSRDRGGGYGEAAAREEARRALNRASLEAGQAGREADTARDAWQRAVQPVLAAAPGEAAP